MNVYTLVKNLLVSQIFNSLYHFITSADFGLQSLEFEPLQSSNLFGTTFLMAIISACQYCGKRFPRRSTMKEHEKSFCRARVAFEENRKLKGDEQEESNSGEHSPVSVSPPPSSTQEAVRIPLSTRFEPIF